MDPTPIPEGKARARLAPKIVRALLLPLRGGLNAWLARAVERGDEAAAAKALRLGANPDARGAAGLTPLTINHVLADPRCAAMAKLLASFGADPNLPNLDGLRPLHYAAQFAMADLCSALLGAGADPDAANASGQTPWQMLREFQAKSPGHHGIDQAGQIGALFEQASLARAAAAPPGPALDSPARPGGRSRL